MSCRDADPGTGPVFCFVLDLSYLDVWGTACPASALMLLWLLGKGDWVTRDAGE